MIGIRKFAATLFLALGLLLPTTAAPPPVMAAVVAIAPDTNAAQAATWWQRLKNWASELEWLGEIIAIVANIYKLYQTYFDDMNKRAEEGAKLLVETTGTQARMDAELWQAMIDSETYETYKGAMLDLAARQAVPKHEYLCKAVLLHNLAGTTRDFEKAVSRMVLSAIEAMYRGPTDDGSGPQYVFDEEQLRCAAKFASPVDGYDATCIDTTKVGPNKRTFVDADLLPFSMDGSVALELPEMTSKAIKFTDGSTMVVNVPNPKNENQRMWLAGMYYCFQLAGPRPTPGWGEKNMSRPVGKTERARFDHALASQSTALKPCADLLAYFTRPNKGASAALVAEQEKLCSAATGLIEATEMTAKFDNCKKGLSPYQAELLRQIECKSPHSYMANLQSGGTFWEGSDDALVCATSWNNWQTKIAAKQGALVDAVLGVQSGKGNWRGIGGGASGAVDDHPLTPPRRFVKEEVPVQTVPKARTIKIQTPPLPSQKGEPVFADELPWPEAVSQ